METKNYLVVDSVEKLEEAIARTKEAQKVFATYTQEQVDKIFLAAASAANKARIPLAKMAVEETGMGIVEDKVIKNNYAITITGPQSGPQNRGSIRLTNQLE